MVLCSGDHKKLLRIFKIQKRIVRIITNSPYRTSCRKLFGKLNILTVPCIYIQEILEISRKLQCLKNSDVHRYSTRNNEKLYVNVHRTQLYAKSIMHRSITFYNKLPKDIKNIKSDQTFKKIVSKLLISGSLYTIE